ncbi:hypothetical protein PINS_up023905 [Pythium insidiosum]|nr:hypothetical protein PINS_up023905 [Pythium insidiosum]
MLDKSKKAAEAREQRILFRRTEAARRDLGKVSLEDVFNSLQQERPSITETLARLSNIPTKLAKEESRRPKYDVLQRPVLNEDAFYLLPKKLLKASMKVLPLRNAFDEAIWVASQSSQSQSQSQSEATSDNQKQEVVTIASVGAFSRRRIEVMMQLSNLRDACEDGDSFVKWLRQLRIRVPPSLQPDVDIMTATIADSYPSSRLQGFDNSEYVMSMLYRIQPPHEFNDAIIRAVCDRILQVYPKTHHAGMPTAKPKSKMQTKQRVAPSLIDRIKTLADDPDINTLLLPVNFGNTHWCGIIVDVEGKRVCYYDSLSSAHYKSALDNLAQLIVKDATPRLYCCRHQRTNSVRRLQLWILRLHEVLALRRSVCVTRSYCECHRHTACRAPTIPPSWQVSIEFNQRAAQ